MPQTISRSEKGQIIGGIFTSTDNANKAVEAFQKLGISIKDIQIVYKLNNAEAEDGYTSLLVNRGFSEAQALYYNHVIREGKVLLAVYEVTDPAPVIDIFDKYKAEFNPNGSRNIREDAMNMTTGAIVGAAAGGAVGVVLGGPVGLVAGLATGAVVGGSAGAIDGKKVEHKK